MSDTRVKAASPLQLKFDLWWQLTVRAVEMRHRGSFLGVVWTVLNPLMSLALYVTVFGFIFPSQFHALPAETTVDYALAVFLGLILFHLAADTIAASPIYIISNPNLVKKVVFPLEILPLANTCALWFHFFISFCLLILACVLTGRFPSLENLLWLPAIFAPLFFLTQGLSWLLGAIGVFFRDVSQVVGFAIQVVLWTSFVFFSASTVEQKYPKIWEILRWNPLLHTIDLSRRSLLWHQSIDLGYLAYTWIVGLAVFFFGRWFFRKWQPAFADVI